MCCSLHLSFAMRTATTRWYLAAPPPRRRLLPSVRLSSSSSSRCIVPLRLQVQIANEGISQTTELTVAVFLLSTSFGIRCLDSTRLHSSSPSPLRRHSSFVHRRSSFFVLRRSSFVVVRRSSIVDRRSSSNELRSVRLLALPPSLTVSEPTVHNSAAPQPHSHSHSSLTHSG